MKIAGFQKNSFVDYPEKIAAVVFTQGCNMRCGYCHNSMLINDEKKENMISEEEILEFLKKRKNLLDGVVVTGGEPTLQKSLEEFIRKIKALGYPVKLDTNGTNPLILKSLIDKKLVDYVAMDIKAPFIKYNDICCSTINIENVKHSIEILLQGKVDYEFRTTLAPELDQEDINEMVKMITGAKKYVLQHCREIDKENGGYTGKIHTKDINKDIFDGIKDKINNIQIRGAWEYSGDYRNQLEAHKRSQQE